MYLQSSSKSKKVNAMKIDIYKPRLDVPFKKSVVPKERNPIPPIRQYWSDFVETLSKTLAERNTSTRIIEAPLWQITSDKVLELSSEANLIFIPIKCVRIGAMTIVCFFICKW